MSKGARLGIAIVLVLVALALAASRWLLFTEAGLQFVLARIEHLPTVSIKTTNARGTIAGSLSVDEIVVDHEALHLVARDVRVKPHLLHIGVLRDDLQRDRGLRGPRYKVHHQDGGVASGV